ncbi:DUF4951 domain-containing protein [Acinetobacter cumulans]|jgi:hypothetical protein|uniref:DUF4951 domain-containing protein n=1 Tax=Acinetobacter cumulans TaxID=2136182 RepID=A0A498CUN2_9GAMM|nr:MULTISPECIES: DUF4951 domain-containing protein [Acinetobacter]QCO21301.1 DUF4951 domain-containing protein [Acinetobacter cumulans]RKG44602.1 DUF4951 domain-containing protein [Acinetobacter cumulans]RLL34120.1 DUF4951 domain-containing protein [Acinetobacter cumulans]RZG59787.1 DUF4951 domain-containing protein [Acinetobacter sp. WCHAc060006]
MFKSVLLSAVLLSVSVASFAEIQISEKVRPTIKSLVNPNIDRLAIPPTPNNMSLPAFGQGIIGWGTGPDGAEKRLNNISKEDVEKLKTQDVTLEMVQTWQKFYENETQRNAGNPTAPFRAQLMKKIAGLW